MTDAERLESIRKNLSGAAAGPSAGNGVTRDDIDFLMAVIAELQKKNAVLSRHVLELTEEMENVRMDFGGSR